MEQFEDVETYHAWDYEDCEGSLLTHFYGGNGEYVNYEDYKALLNAYKELKHRMEGLEK